MKSVNTKYFLVGVLTIISIFHLHAQTVFSGKVMNSKKEPVAAASIRIKESNVGVNADSLGNFSLSTIEKGKRTLEVSSVGYNTKEMQINLGDSALHLEIILRDETKALADVVVSAGSFEASDKAKGASLTPMDAVTVAGNGG